jgi:hypothetical protein
LAMHKNTPQGQQANHDRRRSPQLKLVLLCR